MAPGTNHITDAQRDPSGIVTRHTRTHQLSPGEAGPQESKDTWVRGRERERKHLNTPMGILPAPIAYAGIQVYVCWGAYHNTN